MSDPIFDNKGQLEIVQGLLIAGEIVEAVLDCKGVRTGFVGITNKRVIFYDKTHFGGKKAIVSIPYSKVAMVATEGDRGFFGGTSKIFMRDAGGDHVEFEFRGQDKAQLAHSLILQHLL
jgi:Bacterial PH domain